jgi:hypothetical protein
MEGTMRDEQEAARAREVHLRFLKASTESEIDAAFATFDCVIRPTQARAWRRSWGTPIE